MGWYVWLPIEESDGADNSLQPMCHVEFVFIWQGDLNFTLRLVLSDCLFEIVVEGRCDFTAAYELRHAS